MSNASLAERRTQAVAPAAYSIHPFYPQRAQGSYIWDADGNKYLDWSVGIAVMNIGHSHPHVIDAVKRQAESFQHLCFAVGMHESYIALAEKLNSIAPGPNPKKTFLINSGAEAVENAVKVARVYTSRQGIITFTHAFHGRTHMALSLTGKANPYKEGFAPRAAEIYRLNYPYCYRCPYTGSQDTGLQGGQCCQHDLAQIRDHVKTTIGEGEVAAFVIEPVAGEGGFIPAPPEFLRALRTYCDEIGALWIDDEVQAGIGRTGAWWTVDHYDLEPDLVCSAKALSSGFPLSAVIGKASIMDEIRGGQLGSTFGGNPTACAAALATLEVIEQDSLLQRAQVIGDTMKARLLDLQRELPQIGDVRGLGAMIGIELVDDPVTKTPHKHAQAAIVNHARDNGLVLLPTGTYSNVIRLLPPINMTDAELDEGMTKLEAAIRHALAPVAVAAD
ncbi:MAG: 4-aminobutyrate--2-oxoglutarate transaminase [Deinococcota bacterium]